MGQVLASSLYRGGVAMLSLGIAAVGIWVVGWALSSSEGVPQPEATRSVRPLGNGAIAFAAGPDADIFVVDSVGTDPRRLVDRHGKGLESGLDIAWSPDGSRLAFTDLRPNGSRALYVMDAEGGAPVGVSSDIDVASIPSWSPDGTRLAFGGFAGLTGYEVYSVGADGAGLQRLTETPDNGVDGAFMPAWSPDGSRIAYRVNRYDQGLEEESSGIFVMGSDGRDPVTVSWSSQVDEVPVWSPDGQAIAFLRKSAGPSGVFIAGTTEGAGVTRASGPDVYVTSSPRWSPDSQALVFSARPLDSDALEIHVAHWGAAGEEVLVEGDYAADPVWSPDGRRIAFLREDPASGSLGIWLMRPDGTSLTELAGGLGEAGGIAWQAVPIGEGKPDSPEYLPLGERWAPPTYREGDKRVMPVTFPDGTAAELIYPLKLRLEELSAYPDTFAEGGPRRCGLTVHATRHDPHLGWISGNAPVAEHVRPDGATVALREGNRAHRPYDFLVYRFDSWSVLVPCRGSLDREQLATWADNLHGRESSDGLLVLEGTGPLVLHPWRDQNGPALRFSGRQVLVDIRPLSEQCDPASGWGGDTEPRDGVVQWCVQPEGGIYIYANGFSPEGEEFLEDLVDGLEVRAVQATEVTEPA